MYAVGVYDMRESLLWALENAFPSVHSTTVQLESIFIPLYALYEQFSAGNLPLYVAMEKFEQVVADIRESTWYLDDGYSWEAFALGEMPESAIENQEMLEGWTLFLSSYAGLEDGYQDGDEDDPMRMVERSKADFAAIYYFYDHGYLYVLRSHVVVGGTVVLGEIPGSWVPEDLQGTVLSDPMRPDGGVPTYALPSDTWDGVVAYNEEVGADEEEE